MLPFEGVREVAADELRFAVLSSRFRLDGGRQQAARVLVNGSPKSGTTWMVKLIASLPGYRACGNFRGEISRYLAVRAGDVVHGHDRFSQELAEYLRVQRVRVVLMVRDPRDQAVSRMFHIRREGAHPWHKQMNELSQDEALLACIEGRDGLPGVTGMTRLTQSWLAQDNAALLVRYEDLLSRPVRELEGVFRYLGIRAELELVEAIVQRNRFERLAMGRRIWRVKRLPGNEDASSFFRKGISGDWKNHFGETHVARFKELAGQTLIDLGYETNLNW